MNATNRGVNRAVLFVVGAVLLAAGGAVFAAIVWPSAADLWQTGMTNAQAWLRDTETSTRLHESTTVSWLAVAALAVLLALVVIAVVIIARLGGGRSTTVTRAEAEGGTVGAVTISHSFAADALTDSLARHDEILASRVSAGRVQGEDVLHVSVTPRQNTSPVEVATLVTTLIDNLALLTGRESPAFVSIRSGVRSRLAADKSRVQ
ncbi:hypothetical protein [Leucobacter sp. G161]|uniref:hypothetical protein n=1 Tax=Leucobacter sp. G161 TaxID=663704 RepID=UPI00073CC4F5|nr:hypothetical protein [Leucobacter sp. G161]KUF07704.1 hypothetical protein AUL38_07645 [Leucobacter sp. G161]